MGRGAPAEHRQVVADNLAHGRAARFAAEWPEGFALAQDWLNGRPGAPSADLRARLAFLAEAIQEIEDEAIAEDIRARLENWLARHGE